MSSYNTTSCASPRSTQFTTAHIVHQIHQQRNATEAYPEPWHTHLALRPTASRQLFHNNVITPNRRHATRESMCVRSVSVPSATMDRMIVSSSPEVKVATATPDATPPCTFHATIERAMPPIPTTTQYTKYIPLKVEDYCLLTTGSDGPTTLNNSNIVHTTPHPPFLPPHALPGHRHEPTYNRRQMTQCIRHCAVALLDHGRPHQQRVSKRSQQRYPISTVTATTTSTTS